MANWERKSSYLLREIVKFRTYIDSLAAAQKQGQLLCRAQEVVADRLVVGGESQDRTGPGTSPQLLPLFLFLYLLLIPQLLSLFSPY